MIQAYLAQETGAVEAGWVLDLAAPDEWPASLPRWQEEFRFMLGLEPWPERTPLQATVTGIVEGEDYVIENLHFQSRPGLYVTANLYRPREIPNEPYPAVLYLCGHSSRGRDGNKTAFQSHGLWFARHGYVCLILDTLQLGEIAAHHHGTYRMDRWWWHSRGYTPAGVEAWNGVRAIDYLLERPDVDAGRIGVTGISGGGAATLWVAALDPRVAIAAPISGFSDLEAYLPHRYINGHCDCMFLHNSYRWPWTRIAALVAPRPMLFVDSDQDPIFPLDGHQRVAARLERVYALHGAGDRFDSVVSRGGHAYRQDIRRAVYRFFNTHFHGDPREVLDSERDVIGENQGADAHPIPTSRLRVFATDNDLPPDAINATVDQVFVPRAPLHPPTPEQWKATQAERQERLRQVSFPGLPKTLPPARRLPERATNASSAAAVTAAASATEAPRRIRTERIETEPGISLELKWTPPPDGQDIRGVALGIVEKADGEETPDWLTTVGRPGEVLMWLAPRGWGATHWTQRNPPNYVERSLALLGRTADAGRVWDVAATAGYAALHPAFRSGPDAKPIPVRVLGRGPAAAIAAYAALWESMVTELTLVEPPDTHEDPAAPQFLSVLRVTDFPEVLGWLAPRPMELITDQPASWALARNGYATAMAAEHLQIRTPGDQVRTPPREAGQAEESRWLLVQLAAGTRVQAVADDYGLRWERTLASDPDQHVFDAGELNRARTIRQRMIDDPRVRTVYFDPPTDRARRRP